MASASDAQRERARGPNPTAGAPSSAIVTTPDELDGYLGLSELLLQVLALDRDPGEVGRLAGRRIGQVLAASDVEVCDGTDHLGGWLRRRGFRPERVGGGRDTTFVLRHCPFADAALANPAVVCGLHRAVAEGIAEALGGSFEVADLVAKDPRAAGCLLELQARK
jgi:predicted ArsR family transcriptional regulator